MQRSIAISGRTVLIRRVRRSTRAGPPTIFSGYKLIVNGMVDRPQAYTLAELRAMPQLTQTTRHDCVEGWSAIGKWSGPRLGDAIAMAMPQHGARYAVFHCMDTTDDMSLYYESLDLHEAAHPQTVLALKLNDAQLDPAHGAPVRLRVPTQLGYKSAKWVRRIELVASFSTNRRRQRRILGG